MTDAIIIGAGPAGLMAAITAARRGKKVLLLEKNKQPGAKILASGGGRCNISNSDIRQEHFNSNPMFAVKTIFQFDTKDLRAFFGSIGVPFKEEALGRIIPVTEQAVTVLDALLLECERKGVLLKCQEEVVSIKKGDVFTVKTGRGIYEAPSLVLAGGGVSYAKLGNSVKGAALAKGLGHSIIPQRPALVPLNLSGGWFHKMQGVKQIAGITVKTPAGDSVYNGDLLVTSYGISGPCAMDASSKAILPGSETFINFLAGLKEDPLEYILESRKFRPDVDLSAVLSGFLNKKTVKTLLAEHKADGAVKIGKLTEVSLKELVKKLSNWKIAVSGAKGFDDAMATAGGVDVSEVEPLTMASKKTEGLYLAGEVLDVDGISGGYNLQFAFSSGYIAGSSL